MRVVGEVAGAAAQHQFNAVGQVRVVPVKHPGEQFGQRFDLLGRDPGRERRIGVLRGGDRQVADLAAGGPGQLGGHVDEGEQPGAGELVGPAGVTVAGQRRDGDVRNVVRVEERLGDIGRGQRDHPVEHRLEQEVLAEVLREPGAAQHRPLGARTAHAVLGRHGLGLAAPGQHHQPARAVRHRRPGDGRDPPGRAGEGDVRVVAEVRRVNAVERRRPGGVVVPVEWHLAGTRSDAHVRAEVAQPRRDPAAGLACPAKYECRRHASESTSTRRDFPWLKRSIAFVIV